MLLVSTLIEDFMLVSQQILLNARLFYVLGHHDHSYNFEKNICHESVHKLVC